MLEDLWQDIRVGKGKGKEWREGMASSHNLKNNLAKLVSTVFCILHNGPAFDLSMQMKKSGFFSTTTWPLIGWDIIWLLAGRRIGKLRKENLAVVSNKPHSIPETCRLPSRYEETVCLVTATFQARNEWWWGENLGPNRHQCYFEVNRRVGGNWWMAYLFWFQRKLLRIPTQKSLRKDSLPPANSI